MDKKPTMCATGPLGLTEPWTKHHDGTRQRDFYYNVNDHKSQWEIPCLAFASRDQDVEQVQITPEKALQDFSILEGARRAAMQFKTDADKYLTHLRDERVQLEDGKYVMEISPDLVKNRTEFQVQRFRQVLEYTEREIVRMDLKGKKSSRAALAESWIQAGVDQVFLYRNVTEAVSCFRRSLHWDSENLVAIFQLSALLLETNFIEEACQLVKSVDFDPVRSLRVFKPCNLLYDPQKMFVSILEGFPWSQAFAVLFLVLVVHAFMKRETRRKFKKKRR